MKDKNILEKFARWYCSLNCWEWPVDMPFKPSDYDSLKAFSDKHERTKHKLNKRIMPVLNIVAGEKRVSRYWFLHHIGRTEKQFNEWWSSPERNL